MSKVQPTTEHDIGAPSRRSLVLQGQRSVSYLAALDDGRLASGSSDDKFIIIWNLADGT